MRIEGDIRDDPRWKRGFLDRWAHDQQLPLCPNVSPASDSCDLLELWFRQRTAATPSTAALLVGDATYHDRQRCPDEPAAILIGCPPADLALTAARYNATQAEHRPLLLHAFLPGAAFVDFVSSGLPRPVPILPLLIRKGLYSHRSNGPYPTTDEFLLMLAAALAKKNVRS